jgi:CheY-like chemotaxis protein
MLYESVEFALRGSSVSAKYNIDENLWPVEADKGQINQVINNLVINAIQAMPGGGQLTLTAKNFVKNGQQNGLEQIEEKFLISISIEDTGHGIPKENLNKIFDPYFTTKQRGSGLGLATTFAIIKKHGGHISVSSELGKGTTFTIYLPACPEKEIKEKIQKTEVKNWQGKRALVMDDEEYIQELMGSFLDMLNISTDFASNGEEAVQKYKQHLEEDEPYDFVIMDLTIRGGMGGKEAVKQILEINPEAKVIVASGYSTDSVLSNYKKFGFSGRLSKPFNLEELAEVVNEILSKN